MLKLVIGVMLYILTYVCVRRATHYIIDDVYDKQLADVNDDNVRDSIRTKQVIALCITDVLVSDLLYILYLSLGWV